MENTILNYTALTDIHLLEIARKIVATKASAGGVDGMSPKSFSDDDLEKLQRY